MKKIFSLGLIFGALTASTADAGWLDKLGFGKKSEPKTLEEACNKSEITAVCPDMILGSQTMIGCLSENITTLSKKCANFVTKQISENKDEIVETVTNASENVKGQVESAKAEQKAAAKEQKAELKKTAAELKAAAKQTGKDLEETGKSFKEIAK